MSSSVLVDEGAASVDFVINQGADFRQIIPITNSNNDPIDITGWTGVGQIKATASTPEVLATFTITVMNGPGGILEVFLSKANADLIPVDPSPRPARTLTKYAYDIFLTDNTGYTFRFFQGLAIISPEVTDS